MLLFDGLSNKVIGAAIEVHKYLGPGFMESVYEQSLKIELTKRSINFEAQKQILVTYEDQIVGTHILDLLVEGCLVIELKAVNALADIHFAQVRSYLRAANANVGLLLNFNSTTLVVKRITI